MKILLPGNKIPIHFFTWILLIAGILKFSDIHGQSSRLPDNYIYTIDKSDTSFWVGRHMEIFIDSLGNITPEKIVSDSTLNFFQAGYYGVDKNQSIFATNYWVRFKAINNTANSNNFKILLPDFNDISIYYRIENGEFSFIKKVSSDTPVFRREIKLGQLYSNINLPKDSLVTVIINLKSKELRTPLDVIQLQVLSADFLLHKEKNTRLIQGFLFGIMMVMFLYNLFSYFILKDSTYLYYALYLCCFISSFFMISGYYSEYFILLDSSYEIFIGAVMFILCSFFYLNFGNFYLQINTRLIKWKKAYKICLYGVLISSFMFLSFQIITETKTGLYTIIDTVFGIIFFLFLISSFFIVLLSSIFVYRKGFKPAIYLMVANIFLILGLILSPFDTYFMTEGLGIQIGAALEIITFTLGLSNRYSELKKENEQVSRNLISQLQENEKIKDEMNRGLEEKVRMRTLELSTKNKDILDSIIYARSIQEMILPDIPDIQKTFPEMFVFQKPRDIVTGDFFWFYQTNNLSVDFKISSSMRNELEIENYSAKIIILADCTGHGVPGALMTILGNDTFNKIIIENHITNPSLILKETETSIQAALKEKQSTFTSKEGMDVCVCKIEEFNFSNSDSPNNTRQQKIRLTFSGANRPLLLINTQLNELSPSKFSIGGFSGDVEKKFDNTTVDLAGDSMIYLFSDGFADQFGGPNNKKYSRKKLKEYLFNIHSYLCSEQNERIEKEFSNWKGENEQTDDVTVMGIKITDKI